MVTREKVSTTQLFHFFSPDQLHVSEYNFRLVDFTWALKGGRPWKVLTEPPIDLMSYFDEPPPLSDALEKIDPCFDEVMDLIENHAMPLFRKVAELPINNYMSNPVNSRIA